jgi:hypothetical protein
MVSWVTSTPGCFSRKLSPTAISSTHELHIAVPTRIDNKYILIFFIVKYFFEFD